MKYRKLSLVSASAAAVFAFFGDSTGVRASTVVYSEQFSGSGLLAGTTVDTITSGPSTSIHTGGVSGPTWVSTNWTRTGTGNFSSQATNTGNGETAYLPFTPQGGLVYTLEASFAHTVSTTSGFNLGFSLDTPGSINTAETMFEDSPGGSFAWGYVRGGIPNPTNNYAGTVPLDAQVITSPSTASSSLNTQTFLSIILDTRQTTPGFWKAEWFMNGVSIGSYDYNIITTDITNIKSVGFGAAGNVIANVDSFTLSYVPEPTGALAGVLLGAGLLRRKRSR